MQERLLHMADGGRRWRVEGGETAAEPLACPAPDTILVGARRAPSDGARTGIWQESAGGIERPPLALACPDAETCNRVAEDAPIIKSGDSGRGCQVLTTGFDALNRTLGAPHREH